MRNSRHQSSSNSIESVRNNCFWLRETKAIAFCSLIQAARGKEKLQIDFSLLWFETKVIPVYKRFYFEFRWTRTEVFESPLLLLDL